MGGAVVDWAVVDDAAAPGVGAFVVDAGALVVAAEGWATNQTWPIPWPVTVPFVSSAKV